MKILSNPIRSGNAINRQYKNAHVGRNVKFMCAGMFFASGILCADQKNLFGTIFGGLCSCLYVKQASNLMQKIAELKPDYLKIVERAKQIKLKNK